MPGDNCAFNQCGINRRHKGISLFKIPSKKHPAWRKSFLQVICKYRIQDANFKRQIENDSVHVCEKHFLGQELNICKWLLYF